jgi:hypothetical protein
MKIRKIREALELMSERLCKEAGRLANSNTRLPEGLLREKMIFCEQIDRLERESRDLKELAEKLTEEKAESQDKRSIK